MSTLSVLIADVNQHFLRAVTRILQEYYSEVLTVAGTCTGNSEALQFARCIRPSIILLDLDQDFQTNIQLIPQLRAILPEVGIIVLGSFDIQDYRQGALEAGADAFVAKADLNNSLLDAITSITSISSPRSKRVGAEGDTN
jgi:DNA-binding NarL/FixJ family response regulator